MPDRNKVDAEKKALVPAKKKRAKRPAPKPNTGLWVKPFLGALRKSANVRASCEAAGISRAEVYKRRAADPTFADAWALAIDDAVDLLEGIAWQRASEGSDILLMFLTKAHRPEMYREQVRMDIYRHNVDIEAARIAENLGLDPQEVAAEVEMMAKTGQL